MNDRLTEMGTCILQNVAMDDMLKSLANLGAVGVLIWLVIYIFRVLLPDALQRVVNELDKQRTDFTRVLSEITLELRSQREQWQHAVGQITQELRDLSREIAEFRRNNKGERK